MQPKLRTAGTWSALVFLPAVLIASPRAAFQSTRTSAAGSTTSAGPTLVCADAVVNQAGGGCLQASSTATSGRLFPYPGIANTFSAPGVVAGGRNNVASMLYPTIGGGYNNTATDDYATVSGGLFNDSPGRAGSIGGGVGNTVSGSSGAVGGGDLNVASGDWSTVAGGNSNLATGTEASVGGGRDNSAGFAGTVAGGRDNVATAYATVAGGKENDATYFFASVGGGSYNEATSWFATVPGGSANRAGGDYSFAAGRRAKADHDGAFVWGDGFDGDKTSSAADQFNVYASGGARVFSNTAATTGVLLAAGGGSWTSVSDRAAKENFQPVDGLEVLERLARIPIETWNYREQDDGIRHMGPMAQDFHAAFGLGLGDRTIDTIDPDGVALAAIQGLDRKLTLRLAQKDAEIGQLRADLKAVQQALAVLSSAD